MWYGSMDSRLELFLVAIRGILVECIAAIEDYLATPLDKSSLAKRRQKVKNG